MTETPTLHTRTRYRIPGLDGEWEMAGLHTSGMGADGKAEMYWRRVDDVVVAASLISAETGEIPHELGNGSVTAPMTETPGRRWTKETCPDRDKHTVDPTEPSGYTAWHEWAQWMARRAQQRQCPTCQLWVIWAPTGDELGFDPATLPLCIVAGRVGGRRPPRKVATR